MTFMTITIERTPRTLQFEGTAVGADVILTHLPRFH